MTSNAICGHPITEIGVRMLAESLQTALGLSAQHPLLAPLEPESRLALLRSGSIESYGARKTVLREGDAPTKVFLLLAGSVRVFHRRGNREIVVKLFKAPAMFGEMEALAGIRFLEYVVTLERCRILHLPASVFRRALERLPGL